MQVDQLSHFLLHPFQPSHNKWEICLSLITNLALAILTCGAYLAVWGIVYYNETPGQDLQRRRIIFIQHPKHAVMPGAPFSPR